MKINPLYTSAVCLGFMLSTMSGWGQVVQTIKDINTAALQPSPTINEEMLAVGNRLYMATDDEIVGSELWSLNLFARFDSPKGIARDASGNVFVADTGNHTIRRIDSTGTVITQAGSAGLTGRADTGNHVIRRIAAIGTRAVTTFSGVAGTTSNGFVDGAPGTAKFNSPRGIVIDSAANIFVADTGNHAIRRVDGAGNVITISGSPTSSGTADGTGRVAANPGNAQFSSPEGVTLGSAGNLFVADTGNHTVRKIVVTASLAGVVSNVVVSTLAGGAGASGYLDGTGTTARFNSPSGVTADTSNNVFLADTGNHVIRRVTSAGVTTTLGGQPANPGSEDGAGTGGVFGSVPSVVKDIVAGGAGSNPDQLTHVVNSGVSTLYFTAEDSEGNREIWKTNGSGAGTVPVKNQELDKLPAGSPKQLTHVNGLLYFLGNDGINGKELWSSNGTTAGTVLVKDRHVGGADGAVGNLLPVGSSLIYTATLGTIRDSNNDIIRDVGPEMWSTALTANEGALFVPPAGFDGLGWDIQSLRFFRNRVWFVASGIDPANNNEPTGTEIFQVNPASAGSVALVKDINLGGLGSEPAQLTISGSTTTGKLYFVAFTPDDGRELWMSDGLLEADTELVENINTAGGASSDIQNLTPIRILNSNGTTADSVVFTADDGINGVELWVSQGTAATTNILKNITTTNPPEDSDSVLTNFVSLSPGLVVFTQVLDGKLLLWRTDGTATGTFMIEDFITEPGRDDEPDTPVQFRRPTVVGNTLYFMLADDQLWKTTGANDDTTVRMHRFRQGTAGSDAADFTQLADGRVVFSAYTTAEGREPWVTDGTAANTMLLSDVILGNNPSEPTLPRNFTPATTNRFFFTQGKKLTTDPFDLTYESEIYVVDGSSVSLLKETNPSGDSAVSNLCWNPNNSTLFFAAENGTNSNPPDIELWKSDGTTVGTMLVKEINTSTGGASSPANFVALGNNVYFSAATDGVGRELFKSDGTPGNTVLVKDIAVGTNDSDLEELVVMGGKIYFVATGIGGLLGVQNTGRELWVSDGVPENSDGAPVHTKVVRDIVTGNGSSISGQAYLTVVSTLVGNTVVGNTLYFVAFSSQRMMV
ncbi:MAG: hypothetical protein NTV80_22485 [Verrucomicrobia bacterium]|nr:hypothetical protein [Verrucomicrobiota bacterium]